MLGCLQVRPACPDRWTACKDLVGSGSVYAISLSLVLKGPAGDHKLIRELARWESTTWRLGRWRSGGNIRDLGDRLNTSGTSRLGGIGGFRMKKIRIK